MATQAQYDAATAAVKQKGYEIIAIKVPDLFQGQAKQALDEVAPDVAQAAVDAALAVPSGT